MRPGARWREALTPWVRSLPVMVQRTLCQVAGREWSRDLTQTSRYALSLPAAYPRSISPISGEACAALAEVLEVCGGQGFWQLADAARLRAASLSPVLGDWDVPPLPVSIQEAFALASWEVEQ